MAAKFVVVLALVAAGQCSVVPLAKVDTDFSSFAYDVADPNTGDFKSQVETRVGGAVTGQYSLLDSDGTKRIVDYTADDNGFNAVVRKEPVVGVTSVVSAPAVSAPVVSAPAVVAARVAAPVVAKTVVSPVYATSTPYVAARSYAPAVYTPSSVYSASAPVVAAPSVYSSNVYSPNVYASAPSVYSSNVYAAAPNVYSSGVYSPSVYGRAVYSSPLTYSAYSSPVSYW